MLPLHLIILSLCAVLSLKVQGDQEHLIYKVRKGDQLGYILSNFSRLPLWGKKGFVEATQKLNPLIQDPGLIFPGQVIVIPNTNPVIDFKVPKYPLPPAQKFPDTPHESSLLKSSLPEIVPKNNDIETSIVFLKFKMREVSDRSRFTLLSKTSQSFKFSRELILQDNYSLSIFGNFSVTKFQKPPNRTLQTTKKDLLGGGVINVFFPSKKMSYYIGLSLKEVLFADAPTINLINLYDTETIELKPGVSLRHDLRNLVFLVKLSSILNFNLENSAIQPGASISAILERSIRSKKIRLFTELSVQDRSTAAFRQSLTQLNIGIGASF